MVALNGCDGMPSIMSAIISEILQEMMLVGSEIVVSPYRSDSKYFSDPTVPRKRAAKLPKNL